MKKYSTSNDNYKIQQPETQTDFLNQNQEIIPNDSYYAPIRNRHIYGVNNHTSSDN